MALRVPELQVPGLRHSGLQFVRAPSKTILSCDVGKKGSQEDEELGDSGVGELQLLRECSEAERAAAVAELIADEEAAQLQMLLLLEHESDLSKKMLAKLDSYEQRIDSLQAQTKPLQEAIRPLRLKEKNCSESLKCIGTVLGMLNISNELREVILNGPRGDNRGYGAAVQRLLEVRKYLTSTGKDFKSSSQLIIGIDELLAVGRQQCQKAFSAQLTHLCDPVDPYILLESVEDARRHLPIAVERLQVLQQLSKVLSSFEAIAAPTEAAFMKVSLQREALPWRSTYERLRGRFMASSLQLLKTESKLDDNLTARREGTMPIAASLAGGPQLPHPVVDLFWALYLMTMGENNVLESLVGKHCDRKDILSALCAPSVEHCAAVGERVLKSFKAKAAFHHFPLYSLWGCIEVLKPKLALLWSQESRLLDEFHLLQAQVRQLCKVGISSIGKVVDAAAAKPVRDDGNEGSLVALTCYATHLDNLTYWKVTSYVRRLDGFEDVVCELLPEREKARAGEHRLAPLISALLSDLRHSLEHQAKAEKNVILGSVFLMNNLHHIVKTVRAVPTISAAMTGSLPALDKVIESSLAVYRTTWNPLIEMLIDKHSHGKGKDDSKVRASMKAKIQAFNAAVEDVYSEQQQYHVPDKDLKKKITADIALSLLPIYENFVERWQVAMVQKQKYEHLLKYSPSTLAKMIDRLFDGSGSTSAPC